MSPDPELEYGMSPSEAIGKIRRPQMWEFTTDISSMQKLITDAAQLMGNIPTQGPKGNIPTQGPMGNIPTQGPLELYAMTNEERKALIKSTYGQGIIGDTPGLTQGNSFI